MTARVRIGISSCLMGEEVRYDGGHKRNLYAVRTLSRYVELVTVCPEVGIGLGVPRPPIHLVEREGRIRAVGREVAALDVTAALISYGKKMSRALDDVSGYIFKQRSPSCGLANVPVHGNTQDAGRGIYAKAFLDAHPGLPAVEESALVDVASRDHFIERVFAFHRWQALMSRGVTRNGLETFHLQHKLTLMAHSPGSVAALGRIVAQGGSIDAAARLYVAEFMRVLSQPATPARHENALLHIMGYLKKQLDRQEKADMLQTIRRFRAGETPRAIALKLLRRHFRRYPNAYLSRQLYLYPDSDEKKLRRL